MSHRDERIAPQLPGVPPPVGGVCRFCRKDESQIDGDKRSWLGKDRTCCSDYGCVRQHWAEVDRAKSVARQAVKPRRSSADVHRAILEEKRVQARRYREAAKARGLIRSKGVNGEQ